MPQEKSNQMKHKMCSVGFEGKILEKSCREFLKVGFNSFNKSS